MSLLGKNNGPGQQGPTWGQIGKGIGGAALGAGITYGVGQIPGLGGHVVQGPQMPGDITGLRSDVINWLRSQGQTPNAGGGQPMGGVNQQGMIFSGGSGTPGAQQQVVNRNTADVGGGAATTNYGGPPPTNPQGGTGGAGGAPGGYNQIFSNYVGPFNAATTNAAQTGPLPTFTNTTIAPAQQTNYQAAQAGPAVGAGQFLDQRFNDIFNNIKSFGAGIQAPAAFAQAIERVGDIGSVAGMSHNISDIVNSQGVNGYFKDNVLSPYSALFNQQRGDALAQAKEASGNLTGSGYANALGGALERLVPQQNATLSDILTQLAQTEQGRELNVAGLEQGKNIQNQNVSAQRAIEDARNALQASIANASNSTQLMNTGLAGQGQLLNTFANIFGDQAGAQALAQNNINQFNVGQTNTVNTQQIIANADRATQQAIAQGQITSAEAQNYFNQQVQQGYQNATLQQNANQFNAGQYNTVGMFNNQQQQNSQNFNANQFLNLLLPLLTGGVSTGSQAYQPGAADSFAQLLPFFLQMYGQQAPGNTTNTGGMPRVIP